MTSIPSIEVLLTEDAIQERVQQLGEQISKDYEGKELVVVSVLKGAFIFTADLVRAIKNPQLYCDFLRVASYENDASTGVVRLLSDVTQSLEGKDVLLVEDIVDRGLTIPYLQEHLRLKKPRSLRLCVFIHKNVLPEAKNWIDYLGFSLENDYLIGYGLDTEGRLRNLPYVGRVIPNSGSRT